MDAFLDALYSLFSLIDFTTVLGYVLCFFIFAFILHCIAHDIYKENAEKEIAFWKEQAYYWHFYHEQKEIEYTDWSI